MIKYDIRTGITQIKTKMAIIASATVLGISGLGMAVVIPAVSHAAGGGYCSQNGCTQSGSQDGSCAGHGAFGAFSDPSAHGSPGTGQSNGQPPYFGDDQLGSARAGETGAIQKAASEACNPS